MASAKHISSDFVFFFLVRFRSISSIQYKCIIIVENLKHFFRIYVKNKHTKKKKISIKYAHSNFRYDIEKQIYFAHAIFFFSQ